MRANRGEAMATTGFLSIRGALQMHMTLRTKFFAPILVIVIVGMGFLVWLNDRTVKASFTQMESASMSLLCQSLAYGVGNNIRHDLAMLRALSQNPVIIEAAAGKEGGEPNALLALLATGIGADDTAVYDSNGQNRATSTAPAGGKDVNVSNRDYFTAVFRDGRSEVVTNPMISRATNKPIVGVIHQIKGPGGKPVGIVTAGVDLDSMTRELASITIGETGYAYILDARGMVVAHPDKNLLMKDALSGGESGKRIMAVTESAVISYQDAAGPHLAAVTRDKTTGWFFVVEAPVKEFNVFVSEATRQNALISLGVTLAILITVMVLLRNTVLRGLTACMAFAAAVAKGNLDQSLDIRSKDELHTLGLALNDMAQHIKSALSDATRKGEEASAHAATATEALQQAKRAQAEADAAKTQGLRLAAERLQGVVDALGEASRQLDTEMSAIEEAVENQERRTSETATAMEQMNATVLEVAKNAASASEMADNARSKAAGGQLVVANALEAIGKVASSSEEVKVGTDALGEKALSIGNIINVISDIADQTNLLALNAAIEAARAGEAGRGFAVVADEVRKLAEKTMEATTEVGGAISAIQQGVRGNIALVDDSAQAVAKATELAGASTASLGEIMTLVEETTSQVQSIATAAEEQSAASEQINRAEKEVSKLSGDIVQGMRRSTDIIQTLADQITALEDVVATFRDDATDAKPTGILASRGQGRLVDSR
jgi:methyl-accepting chemotaxis protein